MGVLSDRAKAENRKFAEEVERDMEAAEASPEMKEAPKKAKRSEPKNREASEKKFVQSKFMQSEDIKMLRMSEEWEHLCRISEAFGVVMENSNLSRRLSNSVFSEMVRCQTEFFKVLMDRQFSDDSED